MILSTSDKIIKTSDNLYRIANEENIEAGKSKKAEMDKISDAMEEIFKEWKENKNG